MAAQLAGPKGEFPFAVTSPYWKNPDANLKVLHAIPGSLKGHASAP